MPEAVESWRAVEPIPASAAAAGRTEQCPVCLKWMSPRRNGFVRHHKVPVSPPGDLLTIKYQPCLGVGTEDRRQYLVRARRRAPVLIQGRHVSWVQSRERRPVGRRAAEAFATEWRRDRDLRDVEILERDG